MFRLILVAIIVGLVGLVGHFATPSDSLPVSASVARPSAFAVCQASESCGASSRQLDDLARVDAEVLSR